jgi:hypothetical protein
MSLPRHPVTSHDRPRSLTIFSKLAKHFEKMAILLAICSPGLNLGSGHAQTLPGSAGAEQSDKICDTKTSPKSSALRTQGEEANAQVADGGATLVSMPDESTSNASVNEMRLSARVSSQETQNPQNLLCNHNTSGDRSSRSLPMPAHVEEQAPSPIAVFTDGKLTIRANGQGLLSVLNAIREATGIALDMPNSQASDPVYMNMGPLPTQDVLVALLEGTKYNYVIVGSKEEPELVTRIILSEQSNKPATPLIASANKESAAPQPELYGGQGVQAEADAETSQPAPAPTPPQPAVVPSSVPAGVNIQQMATQSGKTTGQVLDELQKRQLQTLDDQAAAQAQQQAPQ